MEKTVVFNDPFHRTTTQCETKILVKEQTYDDGRQVYIIDYIHTYINGNRRTICQSIEDVVIPNPFAENNLEEHFEGEIIIRNEMTESMIKFLMMDEDELQTHIGTACPKQYKKKIMHNIHNLWD